MMSVAIVSYEQYKPNENFFQNILIFMLFKPGVLWLAHTWFLRIALSANVGMHVYVCVPAPRLLITSGVIRCDIDPI